MNSINQWFSEIYQTPSTLSFWLLRLWLGARALLSGIEKFAGTKLVQEPLLDEFGNPDVTGAMVEVKQNEGVAALGIHVGLCVAALCLVPNNKLECVR